MPVLIRELVIRARVEPEARPAPAPRVDKSGGGGCEGVSPEDLARIMADRQER
jgi:Family of unknown function (DUF5908)